ncbi:glutathione S-transferase family protein [Brevundimonas sp. G8]|uniref:glutathione S-transferase family protein n=1 Tax=Brevundimonas sp. G8 TaxID=1350776 RepID=UPI0012F427D0|nr:glutathione S-transferase family protein [Brevundimonas sp. G8]VXB35591.1 Glutathione S-transferase [Brevundimonas sp. G8]
MQLYAHPFSSFCQKALTAFYENDIAFEYRTLEDPSANAELLALWPLKRFPVLQDGETTVLESSSIIEYLQAYYPGPICLIPDDAAAAVEVRMMDRVFDNYVSTPQGRIVFNSMRAETDRDPLGDAEARKMLETTYAWLDQRLAGREWATDHGFSLADCAAAPALFYADWTHPIPERFETLKAYRARLLARPSIARCVDDARPYRDYFPLGAPDRD